MSVFVRRTLTSGPPPDLAFGEVAYSDEDQVLHVGRADEATTPTAFVGNPTDYGPAIATLTTDVDALQIAQVSNEAIQGSQEGAIATLTTDVATLETSQDTQDSALAGLITDVTALEAAQTAQATALSDLEANAFSGAYGDLSGKPTIPFGFTYDQTAEPTSPTAGQTWRERSGGGLIIGEWEWYSTGAIWISLRENYSFAAGGAFTTTNTLTYSNSTFGNKSILITEVFLKAGATTVNSTDSWRFSLRAAVLSTVTPTIGAVTILSNFYTLISSSPVWGTYLSTTPVFRASSNDGTSSLTLLVERLNTASGVTIASYLKWREAR